MDNDGFGRAQQLMALGERHGWAMRCDPRPYGWTQLELWRGDEYLQVAWVEHNGRTKLAATRRYRTTRSERRSFTLAAARRIIAADPR